MSRRESAWARWRDRAALVALAVVLLGLVACSGTAPGSFPSSTPHSSEAAPSASAAGVDKLLVVMEENRSVQDADEHMPFFMSQAESYGVATDFYGIEHPSLPNYLALAGGSTFGVSDDEDPD